MIEIKETIVVEGRDDLINLRKFIKADIIVTSGFGISKATFEKRKKAAKRNGIIVLTDPDFAGESIRKRISEKVTENIKHAYIPRDEATKKDDIGVENASGESILRALSKVRTIVSREPLFEYKDLILADLVGSDGSKERRDRMGAILGIGYGNGKQFLMRLNHYGITREEFLSALMEIE